jgi:hypothetical protein
LVVRACLFPALAMVWVAEFAHAQTKTGTATGQFLLIEPSARIAAMGNAGVALLGGLDAVYFNPAATVTEERIGLQVTHSEWLAGINYDYVAFALPLGRWGVGHASVTALGSGDIEVRTVAQPLGTGEVFSVSDLAVGLGYARRITDRFSAGLRISYVQETIWNSSLHTATLDFGTLYALSDNGLHIGAGLSNFGTKAQYDGRDLHILYDNDPDRFGDNSALPGERFTDEFPLPVLFRVGLGLPVRFPPSGRLMLAATALHPSDNGESLDLGAEFEYREMIAVRAGYQNLFLEDSEVGLTAGGGFRGDLEERAYRLDYAWADHGRLGDTHRITLGFSF